ncbi:MAG: hypothetical protein LQ340_006105 [Diploschistes diacapsis]|nr:MAG: hypothetical protein LQ340_006105 [Diploschistes diacapsis]
MSRSNDLDDEFLLQSTYGALFFGVPSQGMEVADLMSMAQGHPAQYTVNLLNQQLGFRLRTRLQGEFCEAFAYKDSKIVHFYEQEMSATMIQEAESKRWVRKGPKVLLVTPASATCGRYWEKGSDYLVSLPGDHSTMVKFSENDRDGYPKVREVVRNFVKEAEIVIKHRIQRALNGDLSPCEKVDACKAIQIRPKSYFHAPPPSMEEFTGREEYMSRLETVYDGNKHIRIALYGLSGIGKTRIALEAVYKWKRLDSTSIFWVHAGTSQRMNKDYLDIAKAVGIVGWDSQNPDIDKLRLVKDWFESAASGRWILVLDNADDIDLLYKGQHNANRLANYFPRSSNGTILLTTRNKKVATSFTTHKNIVSIKAFNTTESINLLKSKVGDDFHERDYVKLANTLDHVPLALVQAAAFISTQSLSITRYLSLYDKSDAFKIDLLSKEFEDDIRDRDIKNPISATFAISFEHIEKSDPRAADILSIMSMLDTQAIPTSLLPLDEDILSTEALGTLQAFSLITKASQQEQEDQSFDMHRLVRLAMHSWLRISRELKLWARSSIAIMSKRFPEGSYENLDTCKTYLPHALIVLSSEQTLGDDELPEALHPSQEVLKETKILHAALQLRVSQHFTTMGNFQSAEPIARRSLTTRKIMLGKEHPDTLESMANLASVLEGQGKYEESERMNRQIFILKETVLGKKHPDTLMTMSNLAVVLDSQGKYEESEWMNRQTLILKETVLGKKHPNTLTTMNNLALVLDKQGKYEESERMNRQTLILQETVLGKKHPNTLTTMSNLAVVLNNQGKYEESEQMNRQTLALIETVLDKKHPLVLTVRVNLAWTLRDQGKFEEARMYQ